MELKARKLMTRGTFRRSQEKREFVEAFFDLCRELPFTFFAIVMERPEHELPDTNLLPPQYQDLLDRVNLLLQDAGELAIVLIDGDGSQAGGLAKKFEGFLHRSRHGRSLHTVMDSPFFVDSAITSGIQISDMAASVIRHVAENALWGAYRPSDPFLSAIARYYRILKDKTVDQVTATGSARPGIHQMPERVLYQGEIPEEEEEQAPGEMPGKPGSHE